MSADIDTARHLHAHNTPSDLGDRQHDPYKNFLDSIRAYVQSTAAKGCHLTKVELTFATPSGEAEVHTINNLRYTSISTSDNAASNASAFIPSSAGKACESDQELLTVDPPAEPTQEAADSSSHLDAPNAHVACSKVEIVAKTAAAGATRARIPTLTEAARQAEAGAEREKLQAVNVGLRLASNALKNRVVNLEAKAHHDFKHHLKLHADNAAMGGFSFP